MERSQAESAAHSKRPMIKCLKKQLIVPLGVRPPIIRTWRRAKRKALRGIRPSIIRMRRRAKQRAPRGIRPPIIRMWRRAKQRAPRGVRYPIIRMRARIKQRAPRGVRPPQHKHKPYTELTGVHIFDAPGLQYGPLSIWCTIKPCGVCSL